MSTTKCRRGISSVLSTLGITLVLLLIIGACGNNGGAPQDGSDGGVAQEETDGPTEEELQPLTVGLAVPSIDYLPFFIAEQDGLFEAAGLDVEVLTFSGGADNSRALIGGETDVAAGAIFEPILAIDAGRDIQAFWGLNEALVYALWAAPEIQSIQDLPGHRIGITGQGAMTHAVVAFFLREGGVEESQIEYADSGSTSERLAAILGGAIHAAPLVPPASYAAEDEGLNQIATLGDHIDRWQQQVLYATEDTLDGKTREIEIMIDVVRDAIEVLESDEDRAVAATVEAIGFDEDISRRALADYRGSWPRDGSPAVDGIEVGMSFLVDQGLIDAPLSMDELFDMRFIEALGDG